MSKAEDTPITSDASEAEFLRRVRALEPDRRAALEQLLRRSMTTTPTPDTDAELIRLCGEVVAIQDKINALYKSAEDDERTEPELDALFAMHHELLDRIEADAIRPTTMAGARAMAQASVAIAPLDIDGKPSCAGGDSEWLALLLVRFLAAGGAA